MSDQIEQGSEEWFLKRSGKFTGSRFVDVLAFSEPKKALCLIDANGQIDKKLGNGKEAEEKANKLIEKGGLVELRVIEEAKPLKAYQDLIWQIVVERMTGLPVEGVNAYALQWGKDVEPFAREAYEFETGNIVETADFILHPKYDFVGCSPDGLIGNKKGLEMKCPKSSAIHLERFIKGIPEEYIPQVQGSMWVTDRDEWDFVSYDPRMPESHRLLIINIKRDETFIKKLEKTVLEANERVNELFYEINKKAT